MMPGNHKAHWSIALIACNGFYRSVKYSHDFLYQVFGTLHEGIQ